MALLIPWSFQEALTVVGGAWGAGRGRGKYIFKDNLEANIIFILIYPQSSLTRPQTCLMSRNCKMATNSTCLPLHSLWAVTRTQIFQLRDCCRQNGCKEYQDVHECPTPRGTEPQNCRSRKTRHSPPPHPPTRQNTEHPHKYTWAHMTHICTCMNMQTHTQWGTQRPSHALMAPLTGLQAHPCPNSYTLLKAGVTYGRSGQDAPWLRSYSGWEHLPALLTLDTSDHK